MAEWIAPIFDRTQSDVESAIKQVALWKANGFTTTYEMKGCMNVGDMNRIENDIQFLSDNLTSLYYFSYVTTKTWNRSMLPNITEVERIIGNIQKLISSFYQSEDAPDLPTTILSYEQLNSIEENLYLIKNLMDAMRTSYRHCGAFHCGED